MKSAAICSQRHGLTPQDIKLLIPHQANRGLSPPRRERLGLRDDQVIINIDRYGNTTAATIPLATRDAVESGRLKKGDLVLFAAVGAGFTVGRKPLEMGIASANLRHTLDPRFRFLPSHTGCAGLRWAASN